MPLKFDLSNFTPFWFIGDKAIPAITAIDIIQNIILFTPLGFTLYHSDYIHKMFFQWSEKRLCSRTWQSYLFVFALGAVFSFYIETMQVMISGRFASLMDIFCNSIGMLLGYSLFHWMNSDAQVIKKVHQCLHYPTYLHLSILLLIALEKGAPFDISFYPVWARWDYEWILRDFWGAPDARWIGLPSQFIFYALLFFFISYKWSGTHRLIWMVIVSLQILFFELWQFVIISRTPAPIELLVPLVALLLGEGLGEVCKKDSISAGMGLFMCMALAFIGYQLDQQLPLFLNPGADKGVLIWSSEWLPLFSVFIISILPFLFSSLFRDAFPKLTNHPIRSIKQRFLLGKVAKEGKTA